MRHPSPKYDGIADYLTPLNKKSQIATEYLCRLDREEPDVAIFRVTTADRSRFLRSYEIIAPEIPKSFSKDHSLLVTERSPGEDLLLDSSPPVPMVMWLSSD